MNSWPWRISLPVWKLFTLAMIFFSHWQWEVLYEFINMNLKFIFMNSYKTSCPCIHNDEMLYELILWIYSWIWCYKAYSDIIAEFYKWIHIWNHGWIHKSDIDADSAMNIWVPLCCKLFTQSKWKMTPFFALRLLLHCCCFVGTSWQQTWGVVSCGTPQGGEDMQGHSSTEWTLLALRSAWPACQLWWKL